MKTTAPLHDPPRLVDGIELVGEYEGSGFKEPRYLARRSSGELVQFTELLYLLLQEIDGTRTYEEIAAGARSRYGRDISAENVRTLVERNLIPDGFVAGPQGAVERKPQADPLLALKFKLTLMPPRLVNALAVVLRPLFWPPVIVVCLVALAALDVWYFGVHGVAQSIRDVIYQPLLVLLLYGLLIVSIAWHELGHATACRYGGARPGRIGFGIYIVWPAFFTDVTDALKLGKGGRVRTDLGGMYFNALFSLAAGAVYFATRFEPLLILVMLQHLLIVYNLMPFLRLDGYHAISDITGIPDLFRRIKPTVKGLVPGKETPDEVTELKPWARLLLTLWVLTVIPVLLFLFGMMVLSLPRVVGTGADSLALQWDKVQRALDDGGLARVAVGGIQSAMIVLPATGMFVTLSRVAKRIGAGFWRFTSERPITRAVLSAVGIAAVAVGAYVLVPNGEYRPIQAEEQWTASQALAAVSEVGTGRPSLTVEAEEELGGAPSLSETGEDFQPSYEEGAPGGDADVDEEEVETADDGSTTDTDETTPTPTPTPTTT